MKTTRTKRPLFVVILSGPAASGKSTIALELWKSLPDDPAHICLDALKHMTVRATSSSHYLDLARENGLALMRNFLRTGHSVIISKAFCKYAYVRPFIREAKRRGAAVHYFKLKAPLAELLRRNKVRQHQISGRRIREIYRLNDKCAHTQGIIIIDTGKATVVNIVEQIQQTVLSRVKK